MTVFSSAQLRRDGRSRLEIQRLVRSSGAVRVRVGWYAVPGASADAVAAVRCGGSLTCRAALRHHGVWVMPGPPHVRVAPNARVHGRVLELHRSSGRARSGVDDVATALRMGLRCMTHEESVCAIDSVLHAGLLSRTALERLLDSPRGRRALNVADGRSESGLETIGRLRLIGMRLRVRIQVPIDGIGRVDLIVGDRLVVEFDGDQWHSTAEQREKDRRRDSALVARGFVVMRVGYARVVDDWPAFAAELLTVVRRGDHRARSRHDVG